MNCIKIAPVRTCDSAPGFGENFAKHIASKRAPSVRAESLTAWHLLAEAVGEPLPHVEFEANGKPYFTDSSIRFAVSHSCKLAAILISDALCGVDIERIRPEAAAKLASRCLLPDERGMDFFEAWTMKESIGKMTGEGIRPLRINTAKYTDLSRYTREFSYEGEKYRLSAVSQDGAAFTLDCAEELQSIIFP